MNSFGKVPMYKMKPMKGPLIGALIVFGFGVLAFYNGHRDPGDIPGQNRANIIFALSVEVAGGLFMVATGRMWFKHLWHDRYAKTKPRKSRRRR